MSDEVEPTQQIVNAPIYAYLNGAKPEDFDAIAARTLQEMRRRADLLNTLAGVLGPRAYQWATLVLSAGAWAYVLTEPATPRIVAAVLFTGLTHIPTWLASLRT